MNRAWGIILFMTLFSAGLLVVSAQGVFTDVSGDNPFAGADSAKEAENLAYFINPFSGGGIDILSVVTIGVGVLGIGAAAVLRLPVSAVIFATIFTANLVPITGFFEYISSMGFAVGPALQMFIGVVIGMAMLGGLIDLAR